MIRSSYDIYLNLSFLVKFYTSNLAYNFKAYAHNFKVCNLNIPLKNELELLDVNHVCLSAVALLSTGGK